MKKILLVVFSLLTVSTVINARDKDKDEEVKTVLVKDEATGEYFYEGVVPVDGVSKEDGFERAKGYIIEKLKTADNNIKFDKANFQIVNTGTILLKTEKKAFQGNFHEAACNFKINIWLKDGRYKFKIDNVILAVKWFPANAAEIKPYNDYAKKTSGPYKRLINSINSALSDFMLGLENAIKNGSAAKDNW